jgi:hypothetical protein
MLKYSTKNDILVAHTQRVYHKFASVRPEQNPVPETLPASYITDQSHSGAPRNHLRRFGDSDTSDSPTTRWCCCSVTNSLAGSTQAFFTHSKVAIGHVLPVSRRSNGRKIRGIDGKRRATATCDSLAPRAGMRSGDKRSTGAIYPAFAMDMHVVRPRLPLWEEVACGC